MRLASCTLLSRARERELASAFGALQRAAAGDGGGLLVTGALGIGKTRLLEAVLAEAEALGFHTLRGVAQEAEGRTPYAPFVEALDPLVAPRPELVGALTDSAQVALSRLLPSVRRPAGAADEPLDRRRVFWAVGQLLGPAASGARRRASIDDLNAADEATVALVHHLARGAAGERLLMVTAMRDEPLSEASALMRSSLLERGAASGAGARSARPPRSQRSRNGRPAGRCVPEPWLRSSVRRRATRSSRKSWRRRWMLPGGHGLERACVRSWRAARAARPARRAPARRVRRDRRRLHGRGLRGPRGRRARRRGARRGPGSRRARTCAWPLSLPALARPRELAARLPEAVLRRTHADAAGSSPRDDAPPEQVAHHLLRAGRAPEAVPLLTRAAGGPRPWAPTATAPGGPSWRSNMRTIYERPALLAMRAQLLHGAGELGAPGAYAEAIAVAPAEQVPALRVQQARACLAAGDIAGAKAALQRFEAERPEDLAESTLVRGMVAWHTGDWARARVEWPPRRRASVPILATRPPERHARTRGRRLGQHSGTSSCTSGTARARRPRLRRLLCVTEYVLTAGDPYDRVAGFAKRLRAQAHQRAPAGARRSPPPCWARRSCSPATSRPPAHTSSTLHGSVESWSVGGESLARMRLGEALLHLGDRAGARAQLEEALGSRTSRPSPSIWCSSSPACCCRCPTRAPRRSR